MKSMSFVLASVAVAIGLGGCVTMQAHRAVVEQRNSLQVALRAMETRLAQSRGETPEVESLRQSVERLKKQVDSLEASRQLLTQERDGLRRGLNDSAAEIQRLSATPTPDAELEKRLDAAQRDLAAMTERCRQLEQIVAQLTADAEPKAVK